VYPQTQIEAPQGVVFS